VTVGTIAEAEIVEAIAVEGEAAMPLAITIAAIGAAVAEVEAIAAGVQRTYVTNGLRRLLHPEMMAGMETIETIAATAMQEAMLTLQTCEGPQRHRSAGRPPLGRRRKRVPQPRVQAQGLAPAVVATAIRMKSCILIGSRGAP